MASRSSIEWTEASWNPVTGCSKISPGCRFCYAEGWAKRLQGMGVAAYAKGFDVACHAHVLELPLRWRKPRMIFANSMSDLFHEEVPTDFVLRIFEVMNRADRHIFQILTKRSGRLTELDPELPWTANIWMGVTAEANDYVVRIDDLRANQCEMTEERYQMRMRPLQQRLEALTRAETLTVFRLGGDAGISSGALWALLRYCGF